MAIKLTIEIVTESVDEALDHLTGIEIRTQNEDLLKWCEEQREILANAGSAGFKTKDNSARGRNISPDEKNGCCEADQELSGQQEEDCREAGEALFI